MKKENNCFMCKDSTPSLMAVTDLPSAFILRYSGHTLEFIGEEDGITHLYFNFRNDSIQLLKDLSGRSLLVEPAALFEAMADVQARLNNRTNYDEGMDEDF